MKQKIIKWSKYDNKSLEATINECIENNQIISSVVITNYREDMWREIQPEKALIIITELSTETKEN